MAQQSTTTPAQRARWVARWKASGRPLAVFARAHGVHPRTFWGWSRAAGPAAPRTRTDRPRFVPVRVERPRPLAVERGGLLIVLPDGAQIQVAPGTEARWVTAIVAGLQASC
jgi:hypothetical protein